MYDDRLVNYISLFMAIFFFNAMLNKVLDYLSYLLYELFWSATFATNGLIGEDEVQVTRGLSMFLVEAATVVGTMFFMNKLRITDERTSLDDLVDKSREALRETNECLERWQNRRLNTKKLNKYYYLDEVSQSISNLKLEMPILQMAIVNTRSTRNQPEGGDAGDTIKITDSTLISLSSLLDDDMESISDMNLLDAFAKAHEDNMLKSKNRHLWDVIEGDKSNSLENIRRNA